ncbi:TPA: hypothetical protein ACP32N_003174 [Pseudomonas aeruginosa]
MQDALGGQKYTESQILYMRRLNEFKDQIDSLERQKKALEASLSTTAYEQDINSGRAPSTEAGRMQEFQAATQASQARVAEETSKAAIQQSIIENNRDRAVLEAESRAAAEIEQLKTANSTRQAELARQNAKVAAEKAESARALEKQRFAMALANAQAERKAADTVEEISSKISEVNVQLANLEASLSQAQKEHQRLADLSKQLQAPVSLPTASDVASTSPSLDSVTEARIAEIRTRLAKEKTEITTRARTELAGVTAGSEIKKASVVAPVVTGRAVYAGSYGEKPTTFVKAEAPAPKSQAKPLSAPVRQEAIATVTKFEPRISPVVIQRGSDSGSAVLGGGPVTTPVQSAAPIVVAPKSRMIYDVLYVYKDEGSWQKFQRYLEAYGIKDFEPVHKEGAFYIYMGRFYDKLAAARRVDYLNRTTNTNHATVHPQEVPM